MDLLSLYTDRVFKQLPDVTDDPPGAPLTQSGGALTFGGNSPVYKLYNYNASVIFGESEIVTTEAKITLVQSGNSVTAYLTNASNIGYVVSAPNITKVTISAVPGASEFPTSMLPQLGVPQSANYALQTACMGTPVFTTATSNYTPGITPRSYFTSCILSIIEDAGTPIGITLTFNNRTPFAVDPNPIYFSFLDISGTVPIATWLSYIDPVNPPL